MDGGRCGSGAAPSVECGGACVRRSGPVRHPPPHRAGGRPQRQPHEARHQGRLPVEDPGEAGVSWRKKAQVSLMLVEENRTLETVQVTQKLKLFTPEYFVSCLNYDKKNYYNL